MAFPTKNDRQESGRWVRKCCSCGTEYPLNGASFPLDRSKDGGFDARCLPCKRHANGRTRLRNMELMLREVKR